MRVYTCKRELTDILTCIYTAWASKLGHKNVRLEFEPVGQIDMFDEYVHVEADEKKAESVIDSVCRKISPQLYSELAFASMAYEDDVMDIIYRVLILGFAFGPNVLEMVQYREVMRFNEIRKRVGGESYLFREFVRFNEVRKALFVAHIEPKSRLVISLGEPFEDRMPSENWMIIDDVHYEAIIHPANEHFYFRKLSKEELEILRETEKEEDSYKDLWRAFFETIAIKERSNPKCQRTHFPLWMRKHVTEFF